MFNRLIAISVREESLKPYFEYELTSEPMSLFKEGMMRKPDKPSLRKVAMPDEESITRDAIGQYSVSVVYGGALLHRVRWTKGKKFSDIGKAYVGNVSRYYQSPVIVFDGYEIDNTKSHEHLRRNSLPHSSYVNIHENNAVQFTQDQFLSCTQNKVELINFLSISLRNACFQVVNCQGDADSTIVSTAIQFAATHENEPVLVVADDTDICIMLLYLWKEDMNDIFFLQECWKRAWSIKNTEKDINDIKDHQKISKTTFC